MATDEEIGFPTGNGDERELLLSWLGYLRGAVIRNVDGLSEEQAHWTPDGKLISPLGVMSHLTHVEWRWIDGGMRGAEVSRDEAEFHPNPDITIQGALEAYRERAAATDAAVRTMALTDPCQWGESTDLRSVLLHLVNETARHCGHADATRELIDGVTGE